jgi:hypothetical protein
VLLDPVDVADGVIAYEGNWLGGETFVSFDKKAVKHQTAQGESRPSAWIKIASRCIQIFEQPERLGVFRSRA